MRVRIETYARRVSVPMALAVALWDKIGLLRIKSEGTQWVARAGDLIINWGCSQSLHQNVPGVRYLNHPDLVRTKQSKLQQYRKFEAAGVPTLEFSTDPLDVMGWLHNGDKAYARISDSSFGGRGIQVLRPKPNNATVFREEIPNAAVYTKEFNALREYRVHVFAGKIIDITQKRRRSGTQKSDVRSWGNGYVFCHDKVKPLPESAQNASIAAVAALGLDFGGVDILVKKDGTCAVLEVNSAPGIEGTTFDRYATAIEEYVRGNVA